MTTPLKTAAEVYENVERLFKEARHEADAEGIPSDDSLLAENLVLETIASVPITGSAFAYLARIVEALRQIDGREVLKNTPESSPRINFIYDHVEGELQYDLRSMDRLSERSIKEFPDVIFITLHWRLLTAPRAVYEVAKARGVPFRSRKSMKGLLGSGLSVGRDPKCDISIDDQSLRPVHFRLQWVGHHWYIFKLDSAVEPQFIVERSMKHVTYQRRVDYRPFVVGSYVFQLIHGGETKPRRFAKATKAWLIKHMETLILIPLFLVIFGGLTAIFKPMELS